MVIQDSKTFLSLLKTRLKGPVYISTDEEYATEISPFNTAVKHMPDFVVGATSSCDVLQTIKLANIFGYSVAVQATGHGALEPIKSGILISTRRMNHVSIDPEACMATVAAGVRWKTVIMDAAKYGLAPIVGSSVDVGVVGYVLGGGLGPLARSHGFSSDYLIGLTVVTGSGELVEASTTQNSDLFWALRGGKVGFGIVTEVRLRLIQLERLYGGSLIYEEKHFERVLRFWVDWTKQADPTITTSLAIVRFPGVEAIPEFFRGRRLLSLRFAYPGSIEMGKQLAMPFRSCAPVYADALGELAASEIGRIHNDPSHPMPYWACSLLLHSMDQDFVSKMLEEIGEGKDTPFNAAEIRHIGSATRQDAKEGSAVSGRTADYVFSLVGRNPHQDDALFSQKADGLIHAIQPWVSEEGNINLMGKSVLGKHFKRMWPSEILERITKIQEIHDPNGIIRKEGE